MSNQRWNYSVGERPYTVTVFERRPDGNLYVRVWDGSIRGGRGGWRKRSLGHRDQERAKTYAHEQHAKLRQGDEDLRMGCVTLARLFALYRAHRTPRKVRSGQAEDDRRIELWTRFLGGRKDPHRITLGEWEAFQDARSSGAIGARGRSVPEEDRRPVRTRAVEGDLQWLKWTLAWGTRWRDREGRYVLRENAVRGYEIPTEKNPRRPVATEDRYEAVRAVSDAVPMDVRWGETSRNAGARTFPNCWRSRTGRGAVSQRSVSLPTPTFALTRGRTARSAGRRIRIRQGAKRLYR
jgi:hypothetical protein